MSILGISKGTKTTIDDTINELNKGHSPFKHLRNLSEVTHRAGNQLSSIIEEIKWKRHAKILDAAQLKIGRHMHALVSFDSTKLYKENPTALNWANQTLDFQDGIATELFNLNEAFVGLIGSTGLLRSFADTIKDSSSITTSQYGAVREIFEEILDLEDEGLQCLTAAHFIVHKSNKVGSKLSAKVLKQIEKQVGVSDFRQDQISKSKKLFESLEKIYSPGWLKNYSNATGFVIVNGESLDKDAATEPGHNYAVVGLGLIQPNSGAAIQLQLEYATMKEQYQIEKAVETPDPGLKIFKYNNSTNVDFSYIDELLVTVPITKKKKKEILYVVTGAALFQAGNRLAIRLQHAEYNPSTGTVNDSTRTWTSIERSPKNPYLNNPGYINLGFVKPYPLAPITGAKLIQVGNRLAIETQVL